jgi:hypothetical protein
MKEFDFFSIWQMLAGAGKRTGIKIWVIILLSPGMKKELFTPSYYAKKTFYQYSCS